MAPKKAKKKAKAVRKKKPQPKKPANRKAVKKTAGRKAVKKVWRLFRFSERFELPDDVRFCRKGPLFYTKGYVGSGQDDESISHQRQLNVLRASPNKCQLRYMYEELKENAANRSRCYRGYLLDAKYQPATDPEIARWIGLAAGLTRKLLKELAVIGLIERVPVPVFDLTENEPPEANSGRKSDGKKAGKGSGRKPIPSNSERARYALRAKSEVEKKSEIEKEKKPKRKEVSKKKTKNNSAIKTQSPNPKGKEQNTGLGMEAKGPKGPRLARGMPSATNPNPTNPTVSDAGGGKQGSLPASPPSSLTGSGIAGRLDKIYDPTCKAFAALIFEKMKVPYPLGNPDDKHANQELGSFAAAWSKAQNAGLPPSVLAKLWDKAEAEAVKQAKQRRRIKYKKSPEAVWMSVFNKRLNAAIVAASGGSETATAIS